MATATYTAIASITLGSSASSVTFSSIPQDYRDLVLVFAGEEASGSSPGLVFSQVNGDTTNNYDFVYMRGDGSSATSAGGINNEFQWGFSSNEYFQVIAQFMDYSATDKHTTVLARFNDGTFRVQASASRYTSTTAITSILCDAGTDLPAGTTLALYGIEA